MKRIHSISAIRMFAMASIITCHVLQRYDNPLSLWFNIGVQIFFVISGFLYGNRNIENPVGFIYRNWCKILIPCWLFLGTVLLGFICLGIELPKGMRLMRVILLADTLSGLGHLWFVSDILFCYLMIPLLDCMKKSFARMNERNFVVNVGILFMIIAIIGFGYRPHVKPTSIICFMIGYFLAVFQDRFGTTSERFLEYGLMIMGGGRCCCGLHMKYVHGKGASVGFILHYLYILK